MLFVYLLRQPEEDEEEVKDTNWNEMSYDNNTVVKKEVYMLLWVIRRRRHRRLMRKHTLNKTHTEVK